MFDTKHKGLYPADQQFLNLGSFLALLLMLAWFTDDILRCGKVPFFRDLSTYFYPSRFILAESLQFGKIPFWSNQVAMGFPFLASPQSAVFYPPHVIFAALSFFDAIRILFVFHYCVAVIGAYVLCLHWGSSRSLALVGASLFAFGGVMVSLSNLLDHFQTAVWLPWVVFLIERCVGNLSRSNFLGLLVVCSVQLLAGSPEVYVMTVFLGFLSAVRVKADDPNVGYSRLMLVLCGANLAAAGLAMVQLAPSLELFLASWRTDVLPYAKASAWSLDPWRLVNFFLLDKEINLQTYNGLNLFLARQPPFLLSLYLGAVSLAGMCLWIKGASIEEKSLVLGLVFGSLLVAMGDYFTINRLMFSYLPILNRTRFPEKFLFLTFALLWYMTVNGLSRTLRKRNANNERSVSSVVLAVPTVLFVGVYLLFRFQLEDLIQLVAQRTGIPSYDVGTLRSASYLMVNLERQVLLQGAIFLLLFLWRMDKLRPGLVQILLVPLTFFDLASAHKAYQFPLAPEAGQRTPNVVSFVNRARERVFYLPQLGAVHPNAYAVPQRDFDHTIRSVFSSLVPNSGVLFGLEYMQEMDALRRQPYELFLQQAPHLSPGQLFHLLGTFNVAYVTSARPLSEREISLVQTFPEFQLWLYRIRTVVPRAFIVSETVQETEPARIIERLASLDFNPLRQVVLENNLSLFHAEGFKATAEILEYSDSGVTIRSRLNQPGVLVLADSYFPGWRAYVNGNEQEVLRANLFFRGVFLPSGTHIVKFRYEPRPFIWGLTISLATLFGVLLGPVAVRFRRGRGA
jgi:hypothetical protein